MVYIGWTSLGGILNSGPGVTEFNNDIYVFARGTDNSLWYRTIDDGIGWTSLGGIINSSPGTSGNVVFVRGADDSLWYRTIDDGIGWTSLGGILNSGPGVAP